MWQQHQSFTGQHWVNMFHVMIFSFQQHNSMIVLLCIVWSSIHQTPCRPCFTAVIAVSEARWYTFLLVEAEGGSLLLSRRAHNSRQARAPPTLPCCFYLPLHKSEHARWKILTFLTLPVPNYIVIVFMSKRVQCIISHELWGFCLRLIITNEHVKTNHRHVSFMASQNNRYYIHIQTEHPRL